MTTQPTPRIHVKPSRDGLRVALPRIPNQFLAPDGALVPDDQYWNRRLRDGDVVRVEPVAQRAPRAQATKAPSDEDA